MRSTKKAMYSEIEALRLECDRLRQEARAQAERVATSREKSRDPEALRNSDFRSKLAVMKRAAASFQCTTRLSAEGEVECYVQSNKTWIPLAQMQG